MKSPKSLLYILSFLKDTNVNLINSWSKNKKDMLSDLGFSYLWNNDNITNVHVNTVIQRIYDQQLKQWCAELCTFSKLESYNLFKSELTKRSI